MAKKMDKEKKDGYSFNINTKDVKGVNISKHSDGYNYASISCKMADKEHMYLSYEWGTDTIPEFAMNVMDIMKNVPHENASADPEVLERAGQYMIELAKSIKNK